VHRNQVSLTILMLDLDDLKSINDLHGHAAGDAALKRFAERLMAATRGSDLPAPICQLRLKIPGCTA